MVHHSYNLRSNPSGNTFQSLPDRKVFKAIMKPSVKKPDFEVFDTITEELMELAEDYGRSLDETLRGFIECNCSMKALKKVLSKSDLCLKWRREDDLILMKRDEEGFREAYEELLKKKGLSEVNKRLNFLEIA
jgi:hypothetical protein